jgi:SAM-dependent methyltransferase
MRAGGTERVEVSRNAVVGAGPYRWRTPDTQCHSFIYEARRPIRRRKYARFMFEADGMARALKNSAPGDDGCPPYRCPGVFNFPSETSSGCFETLPKTLAPGRARPGGVSRPTPDPRTLLAPPLEERWRVLLAEVAASKGLPSAHEVARLGADVARLSAAYNALPGAPRAEPSSLLGARLGFSFPRDAPKSGGAVAELVLSGLLRIPTDRPLAILDVGAGLGASTWGVVRALASAGQKGDVEALLVDTDARALELARAVAGRALGEGGVSLNVRTEPRSLAASSGVGAGAGGGAKADLVLLGQVLSEADRELQPAERAARHAALLAAILDRSVRPDGALVVVEPALRDRTRHLHGVRALLVAGGVRVFAPCLHQEACPMLAREQDWCHEDMGVDLPGWLVPVARTAGLRWQGLTFSYLVLRPDGASVARGRRLLRVVSPPRRTKGKRELDTCGPTAEAPAAGQGAAEGGEAPAAGLGHLWLLERDETEANAAFMGVERGELLGIEPPPAADHARGERLKKETRVERAGP